MVNDGHETGDRSEEMNNAPTGLPTCPCAAQRLTRGGHSPPRTGSTYA